MFVDTFWFVGERFTKESFVLVLAAQEAESSVAVTNTRGLSFSPMY